jgi:hypothetical protein
MSNPRDKYGIDRAAEAQGAVVRVDDMEFVVRSTSAANRGYRYALALAAQPRRDELGQGGIKAFEAHEDILIEAFADCVIVGWRGVTNGHDQPLEFTREACVQLMRDCPAIWDQIREAALDTDRFKPTPAQEDGEQLGKS